MKVKDLSVRQAALKLGVRIDYLTLLLRSGKIPARKQNGQWLVSGKAVEERLQRSGRRHA